MTPEFTYEARSPRVVFGVGALELLPREVDRLGAMRVLVLCTPSRRTEVGRVAALLGDRLVGVFDGARMHVPIETVDAAVAEARRLGADCCVTFGGGSATGLGKAATLAGGPPLVAVPTTYAGSEVTPIWGTTAGGDKQTGRDPRVLPRTVIYDPALTLSVPAAVAGASGMNAAAHCVEALYAPDANPVTSLFAEEGLRALARSVPAIVRAPAAPEPRADALYGAWLAGTALGAVAMGLHHRLCHALGGRGLPHAETHAVVLPHVAAFNLPAAPAARERVARALGTDDAVSAMYRLARESGAPESLRALGLAEAELDAVAALVAARPYPNPRPATVADVRALLEDAYQGRARAR